MADASEGVSELRRERVWIELAREEVDLARFVCGGGREEAEGDRKRPVGPLKPLVVVDPARAVPNQLNSRPSVPPCAPSSHSPTPSPGVHDSPSSSAAPASLPPPLLGIRLRPLTLEARECDRLALRLTPRPPLGPGDRTRVWCVMPERKEARWVFAPAVASEAEEKVGEEREGVERGAAEGAVVPAAGGKSDAVGGIVGEEGDETLGGEEGDAVANCTELLLDPPLR